MKPSSFGNRLRVLSVPYYVLLTARDLLLCPPFPAPVLNVLICLDPFFLIINPVRKKSYSDTGHTMKDTDLQAGAVVVTLE